MREYAVKKRLDAAQPAARGKAVPGMSNQAMLAFLSAMPKKRVPEEEGIRERLSDKFGVDFSGLKITRDFALGDIQERAYTRGNEIHLAPDVDTGSAEGQQILMHEAAHVIQQGTRSLSGGMLHDSALEAQANDIASGAGHIDVSNFSMPAAEGAPVQGFLDFIFNRKKYNENKNRNKARQLYQQYKEQDPQLAREMAKSLSKHGLSGGTAIFDPEAHAQRFNQATASEEVFLNRPHLIRGATAAGLERELAGGFPKELLDPERGTYKLHGVSQEELDAISSLNPAAYRTLIERAHRGTAMVAEEDWTRMSDSEFLKKFAFLNGVARLCGTANQTSSKLGIDKELIQQDPNVDVMLEDVYNNMGNIISYAEQRLAKIAGRADGFSEDALGMFAEMVPLSRQQIKEHRAAIAPAAPKKRGFLARLFGKG